MGRSLRKVLGKEQFEFIKEREALRMVLDCSEVYGDELWNIEEIKARLKELNDKIEALKLLRSALKEDAF